MQTPTAQSTASRTAVFPPKLKSKRRPSASPFLAVTFVATPISCKLSFPLLSYAAYASRLP
ncbi:hypothetical protein Csa_023984, partial [Cucumis sativus]